MWLLPDGNYFSPDGGLFTVKDSIAYFEDGDTYDLKDPKVGYWRYIPNNHGIDFSKSENIKPRKKRT